MERGGGGARLGHAAHELADAALPAPDQPAAVGRHLEPPRREGAQQVHLRARGPARSGPNTGQTMVKYRTNPAGAPARPRPGLKSGIPVKYRSNQVQARGPGPESHFRAGQPPRPAAVCDRGRAARRGGDKLASGRRHPAALPCRSDIGQIPVKYWSKNTGQTPVKCRSNTAQTPVKRGAGPRHRFVKGCAECVDCESGYWSKTGQNRSKTGQNRSKTGQKPVK